MGEDIYRWVKIFTGGWRYSQVGEDIYRWVNMFAGGILTVSASL